MPAIVISNEVRSCPKLHYLAFTVFFVTLRIADKRHEKKQNPDFEELREMHITLHRQLQSQVAELKKTIESFDRERNNLQEIKQEWDAGMRNLTAAMGRMTESLTTESYMRAQAEESLSDTQVRYDLLAASAPVLIWQSGPDKLYTYVNDNWLRFTGRTLRQEVGNGWAETIHSADLQQCLDIYNAAFDRRHPFVVEYRRRHHSHGYRWIIDHGSPMHDSAGNFLGYIGACADIHERKLAELALQSSQEELRSLTGRLQAVREEERTQLAREIHDELSGSLTVLKLDLSLLPDRAASDHKLLSEKLNSMSDLIDRTLDRVHGIVTGLRPAVLDKFGLVAAIEWQAGDFREHSGIGCELHLPAEDIAMDPDRCTAVFRIFQEALTNVARHAEATKVRIDLKSENGNLRLTVRDNGKGIAEKAIYGPTSFGLLGMRERALSFGGTLEFNPQPGRGTLVTVSVPLK